MAAFVLQSSLMQRLTSILILSLSSLIVSGCFREPSKPSWSTASGAEQYERLMWQAIRGQDWREVEYHLAPAFAGVNAAGQRFDRSGWMEYRKANRITDFSLGEVTVQPNGPDMVLTYNLGLTFSSNATAPVGELSIMSVWQQVKGGWVLISQSETPVR